MTNTKNLVYLSLGANLGNPKANITAALGMLGAHPQVENLTASSFFLTQPVETTLSQPDFVNVACRLETTLDCIPFLEFAKSIEKRLGKTPKPKSHPRPIDLDILLFGKTKLETDTWQIPHPRWKTRLFVLYPLLELTSHIQEPNSPSPISLQQLIEEVESANPQRVTRFS